METTELDLEISKNQISIDFDALEEPEEESSTLSLVSAKNLDWIKDEVLFVVVRAKDTFIENLSEFQLLGKSLIEWVKMAGNHCQTIVIDDDENLLLRLKNIQTDKKIMAVFYSDTPLLDKALFNEILSYFSSKGFNALKLLRGAIFRVDYLKALSEFVQAPSSKFNVAMLEKIDSNKKLARAYQILKEKILSFHRRNGVILMEDNISIDADVEIEAGAVIYGNNCIEGQTIISKGAILKSGNFVKDSIIGKNVVLEGAYIEKSKLSDGKRVLPFEKIVNESI